MSDKIVIDEYILSTLMRDLVEHDRSPSGFLVYLHLIAETKRLATPWVRASYQTMAESTGLSKSAVQIAIQGLVKRELLRVKKDSATATPEYRVRRPWRR